MKIRLNRLEIIEAIKKATNTSTSNEVFKNYINLDEGKYQIQFLQHKSFGLTFKDIVFLSEKENTDLYHDKIKEFLKKHYSHMNLTLKTKTVFSVI